MGSGLQEKKKKIQSKLHILKRRGRELKKKGGDFSLREGLF